MLRHGQLALLVDGGALLLDNIVVGQRHVAGGGQQRNETLAAAVLRHKAEARPDALFGGGLAVGLPVKGDAPFGEGVDAVDGPHQLGASGTDQTAEAQDFALVQRKADVVEVAQVGQVLHLEQRLPGGGAHLLDGTGAFVHHLADHVLNDLFGVDVVVLQCHLVAAVPQYGQPVGQAVDLLQAVADVDDGNAPLPQLLNDAEQCFGFLAGQRGGGLVHDEQLGVAAQTLENLHQLAHADAQFGYRGGGFQGEVVPLDQFGGHLVHLLVVDHAEPAGLPAQKDVLGHRQGGNHRELLVDAGHAQGLAVAQAVDLHRFALPLDGAAVLGVGTGQNLDQGAFAGAVFPHQGVDFAFAHRKVYAFQHLYARKTLADILGFQNHFVAHTAASFSAFFFWARFCMKLRYHASKITTRMMMMPLITY